MVPSEDIVLPGSAGTIQKSEPLTNEGIFRLKIAGVKKIDIVSREQPYDIAGPATSGSDGSAPEAVDPEFPSIHHAPLPPKLELSIARDGMSAKLVIVPAGPVSEEITLAALQAVIRQNGITCGVNEALLVDIVAAWKNEKQHAEFEGVARGIPARAGDNGTVEFLFDTRTSLSPKVNPDGTVDYREVNLYIAVGTGKKLARLCPPGGGSPGTTIFGEAIPAADGLPAVLPAGPNTAIDGSGELVAAIDGVVRYANGLVEVHEGFTIDGDVDFSTGNIRYDKSVMIKGDIKPGFRVECGGDLQVEGLIEDCTLIVGGAVLCKHGFIGQGKGLLEADGDVNLGFVMNQTVKSKRTINIAREAINSKLYAQKDITLHGKPHSAAGGTLMARESITLWSVGNLTGVRTNLEVGSDFSLLEELIKNEEEELAIKGKHYEYTEVIKKYRHFVAIKKRLTASEQLLLNKLDAAVARLDEQIGALLARREAIRSGLYEIEHSYIAIGHAALPGTVFKIGEQWYGVDTELVGPKTVRLLHHAIGIF
jgi:uncharacterized protein (DUF342 family)